jgi:hypothetical protein
MFALHTEEPRAQTLESFKPHGGSTGDVQLGKLKVKTSIALRQQANRLFAQRRVVWLRRADVTTMTHRGYAFTVSSG